MLFSRGLQCLKLIGIKQRMIDIGKNNFVLFGKCLKMEIFLHSQSNLAKKEYDPQKYV
jgi:hypothetical protein